MPSTKMNRKIRCDQALPSCGNCARSKRKCQGYGLRLSWPHEGDRRRAVVVKVPVDCSNRTPGFRFLNSSFWDIALYNELSTIGIGTASTLDKWASLKPRNLPQPIPRDLSILGGHEENLILYYESVISHMLTSPDSRTTAFGSLLSRMAFKDDSPSSTAVRQAILALSSLKLYGQSRAIPFKTKALSALLKSMKHDIGIREGMQLVAASMLLCLYEIFDTTDSDSASTWTWYACGAKNIVKTVYASNKIYIGDPAILLDWVYYHDTLSKFSLRHWKQRTVAQSTCVSDYSIKSRQALSPNKELIIGIFGCSLEILDIISQVVDIVLDPANPSYFSDTHERTMKSLELRLINVRQVMEVHDGEQQTRSEKIAELYRIATLVYLKRAAQKHPSSSCEVRELIDNAMMLLSQLETCERPFPLFVIGCEARDDIQRSQIIDILSKTQQQRKVGNLISVQEMIEVAWIQDDLHTEQELDFTSKLTVAMSTNAILPTFI